jgi:hypothetical protein
MWDGNRKARFHGCKTGHAFALTRCDFTVPKQTSLLTEVREQSAGGRPHQPLFSLPLTLGIQSSEKLHLAGRQSRNRNTVSVDQTIVGQSCQPWADSEWTPPCAHAHARAREKSLKNFASGSTRRTAPRPILIGTCG